MVAKQTGVPAPICPFDYARHLMGCTRLRGEVTPRVLRCESNRDTWRRACARAAALLLLAPAARGPGGAPPQREAEEGDPEVALRAPALAEVERQQVGRLLRGVRAQQAERVRRPDGGCAMPATAAAQLVEVTHKSDFDVTQQGALRGVHCPASAAHNTKTSKTRKLETDASTSAHTSTPEAWCSPIRGSRAGQHYCRRTCQCCPSDNQHEVEQAQ